MYDFVALSNALRGLERLSENPSSVHVVPVDLCPSDFALSDLWDVLSAEERARAKQFQPAILTQRYVITYAALRFLLAIYLECKPETIEFSIGIHGKPALSPPSKLQFNISHSDALATYAFTRDCGIGIDVERLRPVEEIEAIAAEHFTDSEFANLISLPPAKRPEAFLRCWTRKEACIKATGRGLSEPLKTLEVGSVPSPAPQRVILGQQCLTLHQLPVISGHVGALAYADVHPRFIDVADPVSLAVLLSKSA